MPNSTQKYKMFELPPQLTFFNFILTQISLYTPPNPINPFPAIIPGLPATTL